MFFEKSLSVFGATLFLWLCAIAFASNASEERNSYIEYDGAMDPELVPLGVKLREFVRNYEGQLDDQLNSNDRKQLIKAIRITSELDGLHMALAAAYERNTKCALVEKGETPKMIATSIQNFEDVQEQRKNQVLQNFYGSLSSSGRDVVMGYIDTFITPDIKELKIYLPEWIATDPVGFMTRLQDFCSEVEPFKGQFLEETIERDGVSIRSRRVE